MKNKKNRIRSRQKSYLTAGVIALAAIIAMGGMYYRNSHKEQDTGMELAKTQKIVTEPEKTEAPEPEAIETMAEDLSLIHISTVVRYWRQADGTDHKG